MHLTEKYVAAIQPGTMRGQYMDDHQVGFGLRVSPEGRKSFFWYQKVHSKPRFRALGESPFVTVKDARDKAAEYSGIASRWKLSGYAGDDPFEKAKPVKPASVPTFDELVEAFIQNEVRVNAQRPERAEYHVRWRVKRFLSDWLQRPMDSITSDDVDAKKRECGSRHVTFNRLQAFILRLYNWSGASADGQINFCRVASNPAKEVKQYKETSRERFLQPEELVHFHHALKSEPHVDLKHFLSLLLNTGARRSDVFSMKWENIEWERGVWHVPHPKNGIAYDIPLRPAAREILKRRRREAPEEAQFVFPGTGKGGHVTDLRIPWERFRERARIPDITYHDLRRTNGAYKAMAGESLESIAKSLGQQSTAATPVYARLHSAAIAETNEAGERKMVQMMRQAERRLKGGASRKALAS